MFTLFETLSYNLTLISSLFADGIQYYLSTILNDYSRFIVNWKLCATMKAEDVKQTLDEALLVAQTHAPPKLLSDNGSCYLSVELVEYLNDMIDLDYNQQTRNEKFMLFEIL